MSLLRLITWPYVRTHVLRTALTTAGIALGVAVFVGMHSANQSVVAAFSRTIERIAGKTDLQVTAGEAGFGEDVLDRVQSSSMVRVAVPVIEAVVDTTFKAQGTMLVLGTDMTGDRSLRDYDFDSGDEAIVDDPLVFLAQPDSIIVSKQLADRNGLGLGRHLSLKTVDGEKAFTVRGIMKPSGLAAAFGGNLAVMDIYAAQKMFGRGRTFDRIDVGVARGTTLRDAERELTSLLGAGFDVQPPATRGRQAEAMVAGYTTMVNISSVFALFIGMFIIYSSFATAVTQRRSEIGILRALGATRAQIRRLFLAESLIQGLLGSLIGLLIGAVMARWMVSAISGVIGDLYGVPQQSAAVATSPLMLILALAIGVMTSLVAALVPAAGATRVDPVDALRKGGSEDLKTGESRVRATLAAALALLSIGCLVAGQYRSVFFAGYALMIAAAVLLAPILSLVLAKALRPVLKTLWPIEGALAADSIIQAPRRTSGSVAALMLSLALIVAFAGMAHASYGSIVNWMNAALNADLFVMPSQRLDIRTTRFPATMQGEIAAVEGVERVQAYRNNRISFRSAPAMLAAIEMTSVRETSRNRPVAGDALEMYRTAASGRGLIVSDNLAQLHHLRLGEIVDIPAPYGIISLPIVGVIVDYTDQQGTIFIDRSLFVRYWRDEGVSDFRVFVKSGIPVSKVRQRIVNVYASKRHVFVLTNDVGRRYILNIVNQWFDLMNVQIAIAVLVAILGIVNALTVSITDRRRELGVLQALGGLRSQIRRTIWLEALSVATIGLIAGAMLGAFNLYYLLQVVQRDIIGIRLDFEYPIQTMLALIPIMLGAAFVAAIVPSEAAVRASLVEALEYE
jgi:putative ABC transport system permease protein